MALRFDFRISGMILGDILEQAFQLSWIFGYIRTPDGPPPGVEAEHIHPKALRSIRTPRVYVAAGGIQQTCQFGDVVGPDKEETNWICLGTAFRRDSTQAHTLKKEDWNRLLLQRNPPLQALDGHFLVLRVFEDRIESFSDPLGLRMLFVLQKPKICYFATRQDWLAPCAGGLEIDFDVFGARWLTFNQLSHEALAKGVRRTGPGAVAVLKAVETRIDNTLWSPPTMESTAADFVDAFGAFTAPSGPTVRSMSLGLSGGLDSRAVLAFLLDRLSADEFGVHVFGAPDDPDVRISRQIANKFQLTHRHLRADLPPPVELVPRLANFAASVCAAEPATAYLKVRHYEMLHGMGQSVIDGGFGEIARRQFFNRLLLRAPKAIDTSDFSRMLDLMRVHRASIFLPDLDDLMWSGALRQLESTWRSLPDVRTVGRAFLLDLLAIRTRLPNYDGFEQARMDGVVASWMPFAQPSVLRTLLTLPANLRSNSRMLKALIRKQAPELRHIALVKNGITYPFGLGTGGAWLWAKTKSSLREVPQDSDNLQALQHLREFILDRIDSQDVRNFSAYDYRLLRTICHDFFAGRQENLSTIDWWLSFDLWRESLKG